MISESAKSSKLSQLFFSTCVAYSVLQWFSSLISMSNMQPNMDTTALERHSIVASKPLVDLHESSTRNLVEMKSPHTPLRTDNSSNLEQLPHDAPTHSGRLRVLIGILSADVYTNQIYRRRHRQLFDLWNDTRVCSLPDFRSRSINERYECEIVYTFVIGANPDASTELLDNSRPMEVNRPITGQAKDLNDPDMTLLNIKENMNEGKSQTWFKYGSEIAEQYDLDYVAKCDADALLHLHEFFYFAYKNMPPAPYNRGMYIGALRDKLLWGPHKTEEEQVRFESHFRTEYENVHLYVAGQLYILSTDLAKFVGKEALESNCSYCEGHEDHDISAMAFHSPEPVKLTAIGRSHRFWEHPVKGEKRWLHVWERETARMAGKPYKNKVLTKNSTIEAVLRLN